MNRKWSALIVITLASNLFAANVADLTVFERFSEKSYLKFIYAENKQTGFVAIPPIHNTAISVQADHGKNNFNKLTARFIQKITPNLDLALMTDSASNLGASTNTARIAFDLHGELFGLRTGLGVYLPFDSEESIKVGPRVYVKDFAFFTTAAEEGKYILGSSYCTSQHKVELAYSTDEAWFLRASKSFKTDFGVLWPELRMDILPEEEILGFGLAVCF